ncbi:zf-HC2 domain-containing protein [Saccharomonospora sp. NPDC046836]|uniref:anti-sigma factor family protein n=1 Tax=Saccharomonospora sp. NPDC046836 TaxID=3156921 RepID=UPI0034108B6F
MNETFATSGDPFAHLDAAYVLGALSPQDRAAFEDHLSSCAACAHAVRELAGMPGLLAQVDVRSQLRPEPPPAGVLPALLAGARRHRRRLVTTVAAAVTAVAAAVTLVLALVLPGNEPQGTEMTALGPYPVRASVSLEPAAWGTKVAMSCSYRGARGGDYVLVAVRRDGTVRELASWYAVPEDTAEMSVGTPLHPDEIAALEIRLPDGRALLRLPVSS